MQEKKNNIEAKETVSGSDCKSIVVGRLEEPIRLSFVQLKKELNDLRNEVLEKKAEVVSKSFLINKRIEKLLHSGTVHIDQQEYKQSEASVTQYATLLDGICAELNDEIAYFDLFLGDKCPERVAVPKNSADSFDTIAKEKIQGIKRYIKAIGRDLSVSYSRYCYGFDSQVKRIDQVESLVKKEDN